MADSWEDLDNDYVTPSLCVISTPQEETQRPQTREDEDFCTIRKEETKYKNLPTECSSTSSSRVLLVNLTVLSNNAVHNKFDSHSVNDSEAKSVLIRRIESNYEHYANDRQLLADGIIKIIEPGTSWRDALIELRAQFPGNYWTPIWPPKLE